MRAARNRGEDALRARMAQILPWNMGALAIATLGLLCIIIGIVLRPLGRMLIVQRQGSIPVLLIACIPWVVASLATAAGWCCMPFPGAAFSHLPHILSSLMMPL